MSLRSGWGDWNPPELTSASKLIVASAVGTFGISPFVLSCLGLREKRLVPGEPRLRGALTVGFLFLLLTILGLVFIRFAGPSGSILASIAAGAVIVGSLGALAIYGRVIAAVLRYVRWIEKVAREYPLFSNRDPLPHEEKLYLMVADEVAKKPLDPDLQRRAVSEANGDEIVAQKLYVTLRVAALRASEEGSTPP
jgi:hypothetical protein